MIPPQISALIGAEVEEPALPLLGVVCTCIRAELERSVLQNEFDCRFCVCVVVQVFGVVTDIDDHSYSPSPFDCATFLYIVVRRKRGPPDHTAPRVYID